MLARILFGEVFDELRDVRKQLYQYRKESRNIMSALNDLVKEVALEKEVTASALKAFDSFAERLEAAHTGTSDEDIATVLADMRANRVALAEAVAANTPAGDEVPNTPTPVVDVPVAPVSDDTAPTV
jgi:hypothetical protein